MKIGLRGLGILCWIIAYWIIIIFKDSMSKDLLYADLFLWFLGMGLIIWGEFIINKK